MFKLLDFLTSPRNLPSPPGLPVRELHRINDLGMARRPAPAALFCAEIAAVSRYRGR